MNLERARDDGWVGGRLEGDHDGSGLDRVSEALLDGEREDLDGDGLGLRVKSGVEDAEKVPLDDRSADAARGGKASRKVKIR